MDNIYKAVQLTIDSQNLALSKTPTHVYIANQYVDTNDTPLITAPFIIQKALENGTGVVDIVSSTIGSIYEVRLLCDAEVLISGYFYMPPMNAKFSELELYTSYPPRTPPVVNEFWQKTESFILEKTNTLLNFVQVFNSLSSMRLSLGYLDELLTTKKSNLVSAINEVVSVKADKATTLVGYGISDAYTKSEIDTDFSGIKTLYDKNVQAGAGANGWTDLLVQTQNGRTQAEKNKDTVSVKDFGAKGDGVTDDTQAFANAALANVAVNVPKGAYVINQNIVGNFWTNDGVETKGDGCIYIKDNRKQQMLSKVIEKMYNGHPVNITCFGDSTTEGVGSSQHTKFRLESGQEITWTCSSAYPAQLQKLLQDIFNNSNIKVNNAGYAGKTLYNGWAANNIKSKVTDAFATEILIIGFGLNDVANSDFTADKYLIELKKIVGYAISRNIVPIILTPNYNANEPWRSNYKLFATVINSIIEYCKADNILCVDVHKDLQKAFSSSTKVTTTLGYIAPDTLHYNNYGYGLVASSIVANLVANVFIVDGYTKITPEMGNIYRASEQTTQYYNPNLAGIGGNYVWGNKDLQVNDELYEVWFYNTMPNAVLRYHAISNDGCVNTDRLSILVLNAAADDTAIYKHIASGTPYEHGIATAVENSQILQTLDVGLYKVGLKLNTALPNSTTDGFVLSGYFSVSAQPQLSYANSAVLPKKTAPYCKSLVLDVNNDVRFGFGDNTTLLVTGLMPKDSGFIICQSPAMYSNAEIKNGRDAIHDNTQEGILIFRDVWGNTKLYRVVHINKIEQIWLNELTSISNSYTDDNIVMLVNLKKDTTNFTLSVSYQKGGTGNLSYTAKHKDWNMPVGGITGSVFRGTSADSELLVSLNYELL